MKFTKIELMDIERWFAVDRLGKIIVFTSGGIGNIPHFVCDSIENTNNLETYFENTATKITEINLEKSIKNSKNACNDFEGLIEKGLYGFDCSDGKTLMTNYYKKTAPQKPLLISDLPKDISDILLKNKLNVDADDTEVIEVEHAYRIEPPFDNFIAQIISGELSVSNNLFANNTAKLSYKKIMKEFKRSKDIKCEKLKCDDYITEQTKWFRCCYKITSLDKMYSVYIVYAEDRTICGKGGLYSLQISKADDNPTLDFNNKAGVWVEV